MIISINRTATFVCYLRNLKQEDRYDKKNNFFCTTVNFIRSDI